MKSAVFSLRSPCTQQPQSCGSFKEAPRRVIDSLLRSNNGDKSPSASQHHRVLHEAVFQRLPFSLQWDNVTLLKCNDEVEKESEIMKLCVSCSAPLILCHLPLSWEDQNVQSSLGTQGVQNPQFDNDICRTVVGWKNIPKYVHILISETCEYATLHGKSDYRYNSVKDLEIWRLSCISQVGCSNQKRSES